MLQGTNPGIFGNTELTKNGPGSLTINNSNGYGGGTFVNGGAINANAADALGTGVVSVSGGSLTINGANAMAGITLSSGLLVLNNANARAAAR